MKVLEAPQQKWLKEDIEKLLGEPVTDRQVEILNSVGPLNLRFSRKF